MPWWSPRYFRGYLLYGMALGMGVNTAKDRIGHETALQGVQGTYVLDNTWSRRVLSRC